MKRISVDKLTARPAKPQLAKDSDSVPQAQDTSFKNKNHLEILDMLESFEHTSPNALNVFIENAHRRGVINREAIDIRKKNKSAISQSVDFGNKIINDRTRMANSVLEVSEEQFPEIPSKYSKLVTFKSSNRYINELGRRGKFNKGSGRTSLIFDQITDLRKPKNTANVRLDKLTSEPGSPANEVRQSPKPTLVARSQDLTGLLKKNQRYSSQKSDEDNQRDFIESLDAELLPKNHPVNVTRFGNTSASYSMEKSGAKKVETFGAATFVNSVQPVVGSVETLIQKRTATFAKIPRIQGLVEKSEKFYDFFRKFCGANNQPGMQGIQSSQNTSSRTSLDPNQLSFNLIKNLRLSKQNIKAHLAKRYGKLISDRLVNILESCNKTMHMIEYSAYLDLVYYAFFSLQNVTINGQVHQVPNMYRMMYQLFDSAGKGFICEHDIFQVLWSLNSGKQGVGPGSTNDQLLESKSLGCSYQISQSSYADVEAAFTKVSASYRDTFPKIKRSVFAEAFWQDLLVLQAELERVRSREHQKREQAKIIALSGEAEVYNEDGMQKTTASKFRQNTIAHFKHLGAEQEELHSSKKLGNLLNAQANAKKGTMNQFGQSSEKKGPTLNSKARIIENIYQHIYEVIQLGEESKKKNQKKAEQLVNIVPPNQAVQAFNHYNPLMQTIQEKKQYSHVISDIMHKDPCKQMSFEDFFRISKFEMDIPQFLEDLYQHMTTVSLKEVIKKNPSIQNYGGLTRQASEKKRKQSNVTNKEMQLSKNFHPNPFNRHSYDELNLMKRQLTFHNLMPTFDEVDLTSLLRSFTLLAQNSGSEKNLMNQFISQQSILDNFSKVFKYHNETLALRLYNVLSRGVNFNRIYFTTYLTRLHPLVAGDLLDQMHFIFSIIDSNLDDQVTSQDIQDLLNNILTCPIHPQDDIKKCTCRLFTETTIMYQEYVDRNLMVYRNKKQMIDFEFFLRDIQYSCLIEELLDKLLCFWDRPSIFSHESQDSAALEKFYEYDRSEALSGIGSINSQGYSASSDLGIKRFKKFEKRFADYANHTLPHAHHAPEIEINSEENDLLIQQIEEEYASFLLQTHKANAEVLRIVAIDPESRLKSTRIIKRNLMRQAMGLAIPEVISEQNDTIKTIITEFN